MNPSWYYHRLCWYWVALTSFSSICFSTWICRLTRSHTHTALSKNYTSNLRHYYERSSSKDEKNFVILWGTHHKTGTYLAQKVFALICSRQRWCCVFQPTRWQNILQTSPSYLINRYYLKVLSCSPSRFLNPQSLHTRNKGCSSVRERSCPRSQSSTFKRTCVMLSTRMIIWAVEFLISCSLFVVGLASQWTRRSIQVCPFLQTPFQENCIRIQVRFYSSLLLQHRILPCSACSVQHYIDTLHLSIPAVSVVCCVLLQLRC
jgi:hypothetical protein